MAYEFWIPVVCISLACGALLIDFDLASSDVADEDQDVDPSDLAALPSDESAFDSPAVELLAANSPNAPEGRS